MKVFIPVLSTMYEGKSFVDMDTYENMGIPLMTAYTTKGAAQAVCDKLNVGRTPWTDCWEVEEFDVVED